jgi:hypothetical protein
MTRFDQTKSPSASGPSSGNANTAVTEIWSGLLKRRRTQTLGTGNPERIHPEVISPLTDPDLSTPLQRLELLKRLFSPTRAADTAG